MKPLVETPSPAAGFVYTVFHLIEDIFSGRNLFAWLLTAKTDAMLKRSINLGAMAQNVFYQL